MGEERMQFKKWSQTLQLAFIGVITLSRCATGDGEQTPALLAPNGIVLLSDGSLLISDIESNRILQCKPSGLLTFWGGTGQANYSGDGQHVSQATFNAPNDLKLNSFGNAILIADSNNHRIRRVDLRTLTITTIAGSGAAEWSGDQGPAIEAGLNNPQSIAVNRLGIVLVADTYNHVIRRIGIDGTITTVAGSVAGLSGDGGLATSAQLSLPMAVAFDNDDLGFLISDFGNSRIRRVSLEGKIETVCGIGKGSDDAGAGFSGDGDLATKAKIFSPLDLAVVSPNFFYFSDSGNHRIRSVVHGVVVSVAGSGQPSTPGKRLANTNPNESIATLNVPAKIAVAPDGGLYFCDRGSRSIRLLKKDGRIDTVTTNTDPSTTQSELEIRQSERVRSK